MEKNNIRKPTQVRSIETKNKIINSSFALFSEVGYYNTNTAQIAKNAGVSTGIVYGYFKDKKAILHEVADIYVKKVTEPVFLIIDKFNDLGKINEFIKEIIECVINIHKENSKIHEALHSMTHTDKFINSKFEQIEDVILNKIYDKLVSLGCTASYLLEKIKICICFVQSFAHQFIYDYNEKINYEQIQLIVLNCIDDLFKK